MDNTFVNLSECALTDDVTQQQQLSINSLRFSITQRLGPVKTRNFSTGSCWVGRVSLDARERLQQVLAPQSPPLSCACLAPFLKQNKPEEED